MSPSGPGCTRMVSLGHTVEQVSAWAFPLMRRRDVMAILFRLMVIALSLTAGISSARAQSAYPERAIEMIITFPPGGPTDTAARLVQPFLAANLRVPVALVNKGGSGGVAGMDFVAKAKPDGYTMAATVRSTVSITPVIQATVPYRLKDFAMIGSYAASAQAIVVKQDAPGRAWRSSSPMPRPTPASTPTGRLARAPTATSPWSCSSSRAAWTSPMSPSAARAP